MNPIHRRVVIAALAVVAAAVAVPGPATAANTQYPTFFTKFKYELKDGEATFKGKIDSSKGGCVGDRKVVLYRKKNGENKKLGGDHTNEKGKFSIDLGNGPPKNGTYHAVVNKSKIGSSNDKTCLDRKSPSLKLS